MPIKHSSNYLYALFLLIFLIASIAIRVLMTILYATLRTSYNPKIIPYFTIFNLTFPPKTVPNHNNFGQYSQIAQSHYIENT